MSGPSQEKYCKDGWFMERETMWPGQAMGLKIKEVILDEKSDFQEVFLFQSETYGKVLTLDGCIQLTEREEFAYHEMLSMLPLLSHPNPKKVLVVGGGDGGVVRELCKDKNIERIDLCDLDKMVIDVSRKHLPNISSGYNDPRVHIHIEDGIKFMDTKQGEYDIIITDSSDPVGPAEVLFEESYFVKMKSALRDGGIIATQGESFWLHLDLIKGVKDFCGRVFDSVRYGYTIIPTYPCGQIGFIICKKGGEVPVEAVRQLDDDVMTNFKYYNPAMHKSAFVLPNFCKSIQ